MAIVGLSKAEETRVFHPSEEELPEADRTYFLIGPVDKDTQNKLIDRTQVQEMTADGGIRIVSRGAEINSDWCRAGLKGWENFKDEKGQDIPYKTASYLMYGKSIIAMSDESLAALPTHIIAWLGQEIMTINTMTMDMRKKLKAQSLL